MSDEVGGPCHVRLLADVAQGHACIGVHRVSDGHGIPRLLAGAKSLRGSGDDEQTQCHAHEQFGEGVATL